MPVEFGSSHRRRESSSRLYIGLLVLLTLVVITFAVVLLHSVSPGGSAQINTLSKGLQP